jgi:hypothetical protein
VGLVNGDTVFCCGVVGTGLLTDCVVVWWGLDY